MLYQIEIQDQISYSKYLWGEKNVLVEFKLHVNKQSVYQKRKLKSVE